MTYSPQTSEPLLRSWTRSLRARNRSAKTIDGYTASARQLREHALAHAHDRLDRRLVECYLADLADRVKPATVAFRYRSVQQFTKWLADEGELDADPMAAMRPPHVPESPVPVLSVDQLRALLKICEGRGFVPAATPRFCGCSSIPACGSANLPP
jgi:site-specific recombinase XerD